MISKLEKLSLSGVCQINQKRQDSEWGQWVEAVEIDNSLEWKQVTSRECHLAAHGGIEHCTMDDVLVIQWFNFFHNLSFYPQAKKTCNNLDTSLVYSEHWTKSELDFFYDKLDPVRLDFNSILPSK